ncbi:TetR/AcrR family transcriptional regulator [Paenibacillus wynnii]|uniref:TetR/AcrR family transcriptional regulator n=1 Tax=Paenibacillus wynnii TaxID=268407 RepID=UPI00278D73CB|nr:TetR/AcrR family transcriptional regulator [Paenibacillus wynnii]MDQ0194726.1 AcrR family transcriptional regulator [Paenibacillus wynnii]
MKSVDRRVQKTRALLHEALLDLIVEKGYEAITVQDIIERANIGRSTFYFHFEDKEKLLRGCIDQLFHFLQISPKSSSEEKLNGNIHFQFSLAMLQHVQSHRLIYTAVVGKQSGVVVLYHMKKMLKTVISEEIDQLYERDLLKKLPTGVLTAHILGSFWTMLNWWMEQKTPYSAIQMDQMFHEIALSGVRA